MKAHQLFKDMSGEMARDVVVGVRENQRDVYRQILASVAVQRKLRPVFIQRRPGDKQIDWLRDSLKLRVTDQFGEHLLQSWLLESHRPMLVRFLDDLEIKHDGEGVVKDLPDSLDPKKLQSAVDQLLKDNPAPLATIYLHMFQLQRSGGWDGLGELLENDERLGLDGSVKPVPVEAPAPAADPVPVAEETGQTPSQV